MKRVLFILLSVMVILVFIGCQATPEQPIVVQKDLEQMIETGMGDELGVTTEVEVTSTDGPVSTEESQIDYAELCAHYGVPERFQTLITEGNLTISCDVEIELPNTMQLSMARVEAGRFSQDEVYALFNALCGDTPMYITPQLRDKAFYEQEIIKYQAQLATATDEKSTRLINTIIDELTGFYEEAPETLEAIPSDGTLQVHEINNDGVNDAATGTQMRLETTSDPSHVYDVKTTMQFTVINDVDYSDTSVYAFEDDEGNIQVIAPRSGSQLSFEREGADTRYGRQGSAIMDVTELSLTGGATQDCLLATTPEQARAMVQQFIVDARLDDMIIDTVSLYSSENHLPSTEVVEAAEENDGTVGEDEAGTQAYVFRLLRKVGDVKVESTEDTSETSTDGISYGKEWWYESMVVAVDDKGIANVYWIGPLEVTEILTGDTEIKPWNEIEGVFKKMIAIQNAPKSEGSESSQIDVTHVSLSLQRIMERDSFTSGLLVPVWNFYGTVTSVYEDGRTRTREWEYYPLISINAIDGSVIDVDKGY